MGGPETDANGQPPVAIGPAPKAILQVDSMDAEAKVCIPNIGPGERRKRIVFGVIAMVAAAGAAATLIVLESDRWWRLALLVPFWTATVCYFQAAAET